MCSEVFNYLMKLFIFRRDVIENKPEKREAEGLGGWWEHSRCRPWGEESGVRPLCREQG